MNFALFGPALCLATTKSLLSLNQGAGELNLTPTKTFPQVKVVSDELLLRVGVVSDIQYCNIDDGFNFARTVQRRYRGSLAMVDKAVEFWKVRKVNIVFQVGF
jgi:hypothetical protein